MLRIYENVQVNFFQALRTGVSITVALLSIGVHSGITPKAFDSKAQGRRAPRRSRGRRRTLGEGIITHDYAEGVIQMGSGCLELNRYATAFIV